MLFRCFLIAFLCSCVPNKAMLSVDEKYLSKRQQESQEKTNTAQGTVQCKVMTWQTRHHMRVNRAENPYNDEQTLVFRSPVNEHRKSLTEEEKQKLRALLGQ